MNIYEMLFSFKSNKEKEQICKEAFYKELYEETRRHRNQILIAATWHTGVLIAIMSGVVALKISENWIAISSGLVPWQMLLFQSLSVIIEITICLSAINSIRYSSAMNEIIRDWIDKNINTPFMNSLQYEVEKKKISISKKNYIDPSEWYVWTLIALSAGAFILIGI